MKKWETPSVSELNISCTENGKNMAAAFDEVRVDQNGNYWVSFASGTDSNPNLDGTVTVN